MKTPDIEIAKANQAAKKETQNQVDNEDNRSKDTTYNAEVTQDDLQALGQDFQNNIRQDGGDDIQLKNRKKKVDFRGSQLDVPGRAAASKKTTNRITDEENKLHSQGSAANEHLEEQSNQYLKK